MRGRSGTRSGIVHVLFGCAALLSAPAAMAFDVRPRGLDAELLGGYDANLLDASNAELAAFEMGDPSEFFVVKRMQDAFLDLALTGRWEAWRVVGSPSDLRLTYERLEYVHENIRSEDRYGIDWRVRTNSATRVRMRAGFRPQVYGRHRLDKDAAPGEPVFRAETHRRWDLDLGVTHDMGGWAWESGIEGTIRDYARSFDERDRRRFGTTGGLSYVGSRRWQLRLTGGFQRNWSRNQPYLGSDLSYREWWLQPALEGLRLPGALKAEAHGSVEWRHFTSSDGEDLNHFGRRDVEWGLGGELTGPLPGSLAWKAIYEHRQRSAEVASNVVSFDEEGAFHDDVAALGLVWNWKGNPR